MTTQHLRDELERIAAAAPTVEVPGDTWARGRRSLARARLLTGAAVLAVLAVVVGGVAWPQQAPPPIATGSGPGLPDHLYAVPESADVGTDLAVGPTAAAWVDPLRTAAVLVGAEGGAYHLVRLPGLHDVPILDDPPIALSPDGSRLAWAYGDPDTLTTGIRLADLGTGEVTSVPLEAGEGVSVLQLAFAPGGEWVGWAGAQLTYWTDGGGSRADRMAVGRFELDRGTPELLRSGSWPEPSAVGIDDRGTVHVLESERHVTLGTGGEGRTRVDAGRVSGPLVIDAGTGSVAAGVGGNGPLDRPPSGTGVVVVSDGAGPPVDLPSGSAEAYSTALAWVGDDVLAAVSPLQGSSIAPDGSDLVLLGTGHQPRVVGHADSGVPTALSIAADLVTADRPTVGRPEPDWPWSGERKAAVGGLVMLGLLVLGGAVSSVVRRRRLSS